MIKTSWHKGLVELWSTGKTSRIDARMQRRVLMRMDRLDAVVAAQEMNIPGFDFHALKGFRPTRYSVHVNGPWCLTFTLMDGHAIDIDFEQYH